MERASDILYGPEPAEVRSRMQMAGLKLYPLFCLSMFEHNWINAELGIWGKEEYVRRFFGVVNWKKASETFSKFHEGSFNRNAGQRRGN